MRAATVLVTFIFCIHAYGQSTDSQPEPVHVHEPNYPESAYFLGTEGHCVLQFTVTEDGATADIEIVESEPEAVFDNVCRDAIAQFKYAAREQAFREAKQQFTFKLPSTTPSEQLRPLQNVLDKAGPRRTKLGMSIPLQESRPVYFQATGRTRPLSENKAQQLEKIKRKADVEVELVDEQGTSWHTLVNPGIRSLDAVVSQGPHLFRTVGITVLPSEGASLVLVKQSGSRN